MIIGYELQLFGNDNDRDAGRSTFRPGELGSAKHAASQWLMRARRQSFRALIRLYRVEAVVRSEPKDDVHDTFALAHYLIAEELEPGRR
jgi:hypothetical protein